MALERLVKIALSGIIAVSGCSLDSKDFSSNSPQPQTKFVAEQNPEIEGEYKKCLLELDKKRIFNPDKVFLELLEKAPNNPYAHIIMGNALSITTAIKDNYQKAIEEFDKAIELNPNINSVYVNRGVTNFIKVETTEDILDYGRIVKENLPKDFVMRAELAIKDFDAAIKLNPRLFSAYFNKGVVLHKLGKETQAISCLEKAIQIGIKTKDYPFPSVANEAYVESLGTGHPMMTMSNFRRYAIDKAFSVQKNDEKVIKLGRFTFFISNEDDAIAFAYYHQGCAFASPKIRNFKSAEKCFSNAIEKNPNVPLFYTMRWLIHEGTGKTEKAMKDLQLGEEAMKRIERFRQSK